MSCIPWSIVSDCSTLYWSFFFFSSRRLHTRSLCDWSSDVCSSDLILMWNHIKMVVSGRRMNVFVNDATSPTLEVGRLEGRSEERRVGKECRYRWSTYH